MSTTEAPKQQKARPKLEVPIAYNGINDRFGYTASEPVGALRKRALNHYGVQGPEREESFLFGPDNQTELADHDQMGGAVEPNAQLFLRRRAAGGGRS